MGAGGRVAEGAADVGGRGKPCGADAVACTCIAASECSVIPCQVEGGKCVRLHSTVCRLDKHHQYRKTSQHKMWRESGWGCLFLHKKHQLPLLLIAHVRRAATPV